MLYALGVGCLVFWCAVGAQVILHYEGLTNPDTAGYAVGALGVVGIGIACLFGMLARRFWT